MNNDDAAGENSLAFLSANRAPGKRQIRVVNRDELATSLQGLISGLADDDEDDDDFCDDQGDSGSGDESGGSSDDSSDSGSSRDDSGEHVTGKFKNSVEELSGNDDEDDQEGNSNTQYVGMTDSFEEATSNVPSPGNSQGIRENNRGDSSEPMALICCLCLNYNDGEVIQCDSCGLTVHEGCYGINDDSSVASEGSSETTEPWFCETCLAGYVAKDLSCELCPIKGGALKRTDYGGSWVHLLCALFVSGCTFGDLERLSPICVFDVSYNRFGSKSCAICQKEGKRLAARTGVCSKCDAGMCKVYYHVTCAQKAGLLVNSSLTTSAGSSTEHTAADPYFLCCPAHSDRDSMEIKAKRFRLLQRQAANYQKRPLTPRECRVLSKRREKHTSIVVAKRSSWLPTTEKWQRLLPTSSRFFDKMGKKAELTDGVTREEWEGEFRVSFSADMVGKFVMPPAFSADFVSYYSEREKLLPTIRKRIQELSKCNNSLRRIQEDLKAGFDKVDQEKRQLNDVVKEEHQILSSICSTLERLGSQTVLIPAPLAVTKAVTINGIDNDSTKAASSASVFKRTASNGAMKRYSDVQKLRSNSSRSAKNETTDPSIDSIRVRQCAECSQSHEQHLMAHCDTCGKHYHLSCLEPPLTKLPKKSSLYGWECSKCFDASSDSSDVEADVNAPRKLRAQRKPVVRFTTEDPDETASKNETNGMISTLKRKATMAKRKAPTDAVPSPAAKKQRERSDSTLEIPTNENPENDAGYTPAKPMQSDQVTDRTAHHNATKKVRTLPPVDADHRSMARDERKLQVKVNIEKSVDAVVRRVMSGGHRLSGQRFRLRAESVAEVGLEEEKDDDETGSSDVSGFASTVGLRRGSYGTDLAKNIIFGRARVSYSASQKRDSDVHVIRVEDLD